MRGKITSLLKKTQFFIYAFLITAVLAALTASYTGFLAAYAGEYAEFANVLSSGKNLLWSWNGFGSETFSYYSMNFFSPVSMLYFVYPTAVTVKLICVLKAALGSAAFCIFLKKFLNCNSILSLIFSVVYALALFIAISLLNPAYLDAIFVLSIALCAMVYTVRDKNWIYLTGVMIYGYVTCFPFAVIVTVILLLLLPIVGIYRKSLNKTSAVVLTMALAFSVGASAPVYGSFLETGMVSPDTSLSLLDSDTEVNEFTRVVTDHSYQTNKKITSRSPRLEKTLEKLGYSVDGLSVEGNALTKISDTLLSVDYLISDDREYDLTYSLFSEENGKALYTNAYSLPVAYNVSSVMRDFSVDSCRDSFEAQDALLLAMQGSGADTLKEVEPIVTLENANRTGDKYTQIQTSVEGVVDFEFMCGDLTSFYVYIECSDYSEIGISTTGGHLSKIPDSDGWYRIDKKDISPSLSIELSFWGELTAELKGCYIGRTEFSGSVQKLMVNLPDIIEVKADSVIFKVNADNGQMLFTSIPYSDRWSAEINGEQCEITPLVDGTFIGVEVPSGECEVRLVYRLKSFAPCLFVSLTVISMYIALAVLTVVFEGKKNKKQK